MASAHEEEADYRFNLMLTTTVLNNLAEAFNVLTVDATLGSPFVYNERTEAFLRKKAQRAKYILCAYIDNLVDGYEKCHLKRSQLSDNLNSKITD